MGYGDGDFWRVVCLHAAFLSARLTLWDSLVDLVRFLWMVSCCSMESIL